ncbi:hypothetical protein BX666DRAFT_219487 [Dichotomocladium elegans]|nr:hypothetical protein BX666DRAFT_219487 [Dichotomocladium elegans]
MIPRCCSLSVKRSFSATQRVQYRCYSSSYHGRSSSNNNSSSSSSSSNSNNNRKSEEPDSELPPADTPNVQRQHPLPAQPLTFMPVVNMPESEFAHNAFFSLHRPLLGLSSSDERPFFSTRNHPQMTHNETIRDILGIPHPHDIDNTGLDNDMDELLPSSADDLEVRLDAGAMHLDPSLPMYYMPESDQVVDYLTAMQDKLAKEYDIEEQAGSFCHGRKRGSSRTIIYAATGEEAKRKAMLIQQHRQRARRQRPINRFLVDRKTK